MQAIKPLFGKKSPLLIPIIILAVMLGTISCDNSKDSGKSDDDPDLEMAVALIPPPSLKLTYGQIKRAWNSVNINEVNYLTFYPIYDEYNGVYDVLFQAFKSNNAKIGKGKALKKDDYRPVTIPASVFLSKNIIDLSRLGIVDATGNLKKFKHLLVRYGTYSDVKTTNTYLRYNIQVINENGSGGLSDDALPCPPCQNCRPPDCIAPADTSKDNPTDTIRRN